MYLLGINIINPKGHSITTFIEGNTLSDVKTFISNNPGKTLRIYYKTNGVYKPYKIEYEN